MRRCKYITTEWNKITKEIDKTYFDGYFHGWYHEAQGDGNGNTVGTHTQAFVETDDGLMHRVELERIQFVDKGINGGDK